MAMMSEWIGYVCGGLLIGLFVGHVVQVIVVRHSMTSPDLSGSTINFTQRQVHMTSITPVNETKRELQSGRLLCWVLINSAHSDRARLINETWGKRCDVILYMTGSSPHETPAVPRPTSGSLVSLNVSDNHRCLWGKTRAALSFVHLSYGGAIDWFLKADDDTYVVIENLRQLLHEHDPQRLMLFGQQTSAPGRGGRQDNYMSGGAGYVLSRAALHRLVTVCSHNSSLTCRSDPSGNEDLELGRCLSSCGVEMGNTMDSVGLSRFTSTPLHFIRSDRCSDHVISFHSVPAKLMSMLDYFIYRLRWRKETSGCWK